jgi:hypothetical protein
MNNAVNCAHGRQLSLCTQKRRLWVAEAISSMIEDRVDVVVHRRSPGDNGRIRAAQRFADLSIQERRLGKHLRQKYYLPAVHRSLHHSTVPLIWEERSNIACFLISTHEIDM